MPELELDTDAAGTRNALVTVEAFAQMPEPKSGHYELHHGEVVWTTAPKKGHQKLQERIRKLFDVLAPHRITRVEMAFRPAPEYEVWETDVGVISQERDDATPDDEYLQGAPDLAVEVLSRSNTVDEINDQMAVCLNNGCSEFWLVNGKRNEISVTNEEFVTHLYQSSETNESKILGGHVRVEDVFELETK